MLQLLLGIIMTSSEMVIGQCSRMGDNLLKKTISIYQVGNKD